MGQHHLQLEEGHRLRDHKLRELATGNPSPYYSHGPLPHRPGHRRRAFFLLSHQPTGALLPHGRKPGIPLCPQDHLPTHAFRQVLP